MKEFGLFEVCVGGQVERELGDEGRSAPVRSKAAWIDGRDVADAYGSGVVGCENVAAALRKVGVGVAEVEREDLIGEGQPDVPGIVFRQLNTVSLSWEHGIAVERVGSPEPVVAELA